MSGWMLPLVYGGAQAITATVLVVIYGRANVNNNGFVAVIGNIYTNALMCAMMALIMHEMEGAR